MGAGAFTYVCEDGGLGLHLVDVIEATGEHGTFLDLMQRYDPEGLAILSDVVRFVIYATVPAVVIGSLVSGVVRRRTQSVLTHQDRAGRLATMETHRRKFASQADLALLDSVRDIAAEEGRQFQVVLEEALGERVERKRGERPRPEVMAHLAGSVAAHRELYRRLAQ